METVNERQGRDADRCDVIDSANAATKASVKEMIHIVTATVTKPHSPTVFSTGDVYDPQTSTQY